MLTQGDINRIWRGIYLENYVPINGIKIWTDIRGNANRYIILCSGGPGCSDYMLPVSQMMMVILS